MDDSVHQDHLAGGVAPSRATTHLENVWSQWDPTTAWRSGEKTVEARLIKQRLDIAAARADVPVKASCLCVRMAAE